MPANGQGLDEGVYFSPYPDFPLPVDIQELFNVR